MTRSELITLAAPYFEGQTQHDHIIATVDGQFFWPHHKHYALAHVGGLKENIHVIYRDDLNVKINTPPPPVDPIKLEDMTLKELKEYIRTNEAYESIDLAFKNKDIPAVLKAIREIDSKK